MQANRIEMTVSSTVTMPPAAMYQNHSFMTSTLIRLPPEASPCDANSQAYESRGLAGLLVVDPSGCPWCRRADTSN